jgi:hypothetical protein
VIFSDKQAPNEQGLFADADAPHTQGASGGSYIESLPDTRVNHNEPLIRGENFSAQAGVMAILTYPVYFSEAGRYYIWGRAHSTGPEDNGFHFGLNGEWPESSQRLQFCEGKHQWTWSSQQRRPENHCGTPNTLWIDIPAPGQHTFMLSMREDGAELDKIILTKNAKYIPQGVGPSETLYQPKPLKQKATYIKVDNYVYQLHASSTFTDLNGFIQDQSLSVLKLAKDVSEGGEATAMNSIKTKGGTKTLQASLVVLGETQTQTAYTVTLKGKVVGEVISKLAENEHEEQVLPLGIITFDKGDKLVVKAKPLANKNGQFGAGAWRGVLLQEVE